MSNTENSAVPPKLFKRNEYGLIADGSVKYVYKEDGKVDWRKMIKPEFLVPNKQYFKDGNVPESIEGLEDNKLLILLGGIKDLARIRGYINVVPTVTASTPDRVEATCLITWVPNFEEPGFTQSFGDGGDATPTNAGGFGRNYLTAIAVNRAFVRAVRNYLGINIVSQEEIGGDSKAPATHETMSVSLLRSVMEKYNISFEKVKARLIEQKFDGAEGFTSISQIPSFKQYEIVNYINEKAKEKGLA
jgi:hypothetical protein